jgi:RNA polymerase sigma-70 factor (ECF subfamily)
MTLEQRVLEHLQRGAVEPACTLVLRELGPGLRGYLESVLRDGRLADEAWAQASGDVWRGLPAYRGGSTLKTYVYRIGWHASLKVLRDPYRRRRASLSQAPEPAVVTRSETALHLRSDVKAEVRAAREQLTVAEQALLVLRVDRGMSWDEVAASLGTAPAAARKRFERVKAKLRCVIAGPRRG